LLATLAAGLVAFLGEAPSGRAGPSEAPLTPEVAVRSGDPAPLTAPFGRRYGCRLVATTPRLIASPDPPFLFVDAAGSALFSRTEGEARPALAYVGQEAPGGGRFSRFCEAALADDGTLAFRALLADGREGIYRADLSGGAAEQVLVTGSPVALTRGPATPAAISGPAIDPEGSVVAAVDFLEGQGAIVKAARGEAVEVLMQTGDPLSIGRFARSPTAPAMNRSGTIAFTARLDDGSAVVAKLEPAGGAPIVLFQRLVTPGQPAASVDLAPPAIDDGGQVAFLWASAGQTRLQRVGGGISATIAQPGLQLLSGTTLTELTEIAPAFLSSGRVLFGAVRNDGSAGLYSAPPPIGRVAEVGTPLADGGALTRVAARPPEASPAIREGGEVLFAGESAGVSGIFQSTPIGAQILVRSGDPIPGTTRFVSFLEPAIPVLGGGPYLAPEGGLIFDARVTGGARGIFVRDPAGALKVAAFDGQEAPGGGHFDGEQFAFHSLGEGRVAFVAVAPDGPSGAGPALYYGMPGGDPPPLVPLRRVIGVGDREALSGLAVTALQPPSRLDRTAALAIPVVLADGSAALLHYNGGAALPIVSTGDGAPGGDEFVQLFTGSLFLGVPIPPATNREGALLFGAMTGAGDVALYSSPLLGGPRGTPGRVVGAGDEADGSRLSPFEVQALDADAEGRVALEAVYNDDFDFGTFILEDGTLRAVARRFDFLDEFGFTLEVTRQLALLGDGRLAYGLQFLDGTEAILVRPEGGAGGEAPVPLAVTGRSAPDGGLYTAFQKPTEGFFRARPTSRLTSDGAGRLALAAATDAGPEGIFLFGAPPNRPPVADAGDDQVVECAGSFGARVVLDGSGSTDPDGDLLTYRWAGPFGLAEGVRVEVILPRGTSTIFLAVDDGGPWPVTDAVMIEVRDTLAPSITVTPTTEVLWPPDGRMIEVGFGIAAADLCDPAPSVVLTQVVTADPGGVGRKGEDVSGATLGTDDRSIGLRADRSGTAAGRTYSITYRVSDAAGNAATATAVVAVPHDRRR
jgi:hypothetical protein